MFSGEPVMVGVTMYILSISSVSEVMMVFAYYNVISSVKDVFKNPDQSIFLRHYV